MRLLENEVYLSDLRKVCDLDLPWEELDGRSILISGATGKIGSTLIDVLMMRNRGAAAASLEAAGKDNAAGLRIFALGRSVEKARNRFREYWEDPRFVFVQCDINDRESLERACAEAGICESQDGSDQNTAGTIDYVFHAASNTHPIAYANDPIGTVVTNIIGLDNLLHFASEHGCQRFLFASSNEIYGENRGDAELFDEKYCGYIDCNTMRAGYPESKRTAELLVRSFVEEYGADAVIARLSSIYGPTMTKGDNKAAAQFIRRAAAIFDRVVVCVTFNSAKTSPMFSNEEKRERPITYAIPPVRSPSLNWRRSQRRQQAPVSFSTCPMNWNRKVSAKRKIPCSARIS